MIDNAIFLNPGDFNSQSNSYSRSRKTTDNAFIESFNGNLRDECLNFIGLCRRKMPKRSLKNGGGITFVLDRIYHCRIFRPRRLPSHLVAQKHRRIL
jgi:transposase InsO family protein